MLLFEEPIYLTVGIGVPVEVTSVEQAYALLNDWPSWRRGPHHSVAINACRAALAGDIEPDTAWSALDRFARRDREGDRAGVTQPWAPVGVMQRPGYDGAALRR
jgi:hypothetical protein